MTAENYQAPEAGSKIREVKDIRQRKAVTKNILEALSEWFGIELSRQEYIDQSADQILFCWPDPEQPDSFESAAGFLCLKKTGKDTVEIAVIGVRREYHRRGIGRKLVERACREARQRGYSFLQVKTVKMNLYPEYDRTNAFYPPARRPRLNGQN